MKTYYLVEPSNKLWHIAEEETLPLVGDIITLGNGSLIFKILQVKKVTTMGIVEVHVSVTATFKHEGIISHKDIKAK